MGDCARQFAGEPKCRWCQLDPASEGVFRWRTVKGGVQLYCGQIPGIKFEPLRFRAVRRIERATPIFEPPGARAETNFLLIS
jgi:hypothetical protein